MDETRDYEEEIRALTNQIKYYQKQNNVLNETKDAFIAFCNNILKGRFISDKAAAEEQLDLLNQQKE